MALNALSRLFPSVPRSARSRALRDANYDVEVAANALLDYVVVVDNVDNDEIDDDGDDDVDQLCRGGTSSTEVVHVSTGAAAAAAACDEFDDDNNGPDVLNVMNARTYSDAHGEDTCRQLEDAASRGHAYHHNGSAGRRRGVKRVSVAQQHDPAIATPVLREAQVTSETGRKEGQIEINRPTKAMVLDLTECSPVLHPLAVKPAVDTTLARRALVSSSQRLLRFEAQPVSYEWHHLPVELWAIVLSCLSNDFYTLVRCAGTSRGLRALVQLAVRWPELWGSNTGLPVAVFVALLPLFVDDPVFLLAACLGRRAKCFSCGGIVRPRFHPSKHRMSKSFTAMKPLQLMVVRKAPKRTRSVRLLLDRNRIDHHMSFERLSGCKFVLVDPNVGLRIFGIDDALLFVKAFYGAR